MIKFMKPCPKCEGHFLQPDSDNCCEGIGYILTRPGNHLLHFLATFTTVDIIQGTTDYSDSGEETN